MALSFFLFLSRSLLPARSTISLLSLSLSPMNDDDDDDVFLPKKGEETIQKEEDFVFRVLLYLGF